MPLKIVIFFVVCGTVFFGAMFSCNNTLENPNRPSFSMITNEDFIEIKRYYANGISFDTTGIFLRPEWTLKFESDSVVKIASDYNPNFVSYPIYHSHDSVFNFGQQYFKIKSISRDSLVFQLLKVRDGLIFKKESIIFSIFYARRYVERLKQSVEELRKPNRADSLFIKSRAIVSNRYPDSFFYASTPVDLESRIPNIHISKLAVAKGPLKDTGVDEINLSPGYQITIENAYKDFVYDILVTVNDRGHISFNKSLIFIMPEFRDTKNRIIEALVEGYLNSYLDVTPGTTLGIPHSSALRVRLIGKSSSEI